MSLTSGQQEADLEERSGDVDMDATDNPNDFSQCEDTRHKRKSKSGWLRSSDPIG